MQIENYKTLISNIPVRQQSFTTKRSTWSKAEGEINELKEINDNLFGNESTLTISRHEIFEEVNLKRLIIKTIYWGYPNGMRGNNFINIVNQLNDIVIEIKKIKKIENPSSSDFNNMSSKFKFITGLGLSTYSKILYFSKIRFDKNPCLILDLRLINVFAKNIFNDFQELERISYNNAETKYLTFLNQMNNVSTYIETNGENLEQFLFIFGNNLKAI